MLNATLQMKDSIKVLPSTLIQTYTQEPMEKLTSSYSAEIIENLDETEKTTNELDNFLGENMQNIVVPDLLDKNVTSERKNTIEIGSGLVNIFNNDLKNLEDLLFSCVTSDDMSEPIISRLISGLNVDSNFNFLPGITDDEIKSYKYLSKLLYLNQLHQYTNGKTGLSEIRFLIYKPKDYSDKNIVLAYDLFTIFIYLRLFVQKLSSREPSVIKNKILFYTLYRNIFDMFSISFIQNIDIIKTKTCVLERFKNFDEIGFFNEYTKILDMYSIQKISSNEISVLLDKFLTMLSQSSEFPSIESAHNVLYETGKDVEGIDVKIPFINTLNLEQNLKLTHVNLSVSLNQIPVDDKDIFIQKVNELVNDNSFCSDEMIKYFIDKKINIIKKEKEKDSNIYRACKFYDKDIPINIHSDFMEYVKSLSDSDFDWNKFNLEEFNESIIKTIYIWNDDIDKKQTYTDFMSKVESCLLNKQLILTKIKILGSDSTKSEVDPSDWNFESILG